MIIQKLSMLQPQCVDCVGPKRDTSGGFVTLLFVLIVFAVGVSVSMSLILSGIGSSRNSFASNQSDQANSLANACAERGLEAIRDSASFTGTVNLSLGQGSCQYVVTNTGGANRTIDASGAVGTITRKIKVQINAVRPQINLVSWQEVSNL